MPPRMSYAPPVAAGFSLPRKGLGPSVLLGSESQRGTRCLAFQQLTPLFSFHLARQGPKTTKENAVVGFLAR